MSDVELVVPPSTLRWIAEAPSDRPVAVLIRHSARPPLPVDHTGFTVPLTDVGVRLAEQLGGALRDRLVRLHTSPLVRCVQTSEALARGSGRPLPITPDRMLGDPGAFVLDGRHAWEVWKERGHEGVMTHFCTADDALPGMARPAYAARSLVHHMLAACGNTPGVHAFVTHDSLVTATAARILDEPLGREDWPWYLEAALFWPSERGLEARYRDSSGAVRTPHVTLDEDHVIELARREAGRTVGLTCPARFFVAGGAFKTLLHGRPPRDLDLWAPSAEDRATLVETLLARGARKLDGGVFSDTFEIRGRIVDVPDKVEPATLEERLARFDLALSAIGAEHIGEDRWRACIDPLALTAAATRQVLLLKPLVNWRHALTTLVRARRYATELRFELPHDEEAEVWRVFDAQESEMQHGMIERLERSAGAAESVLEQARRRRDL